MDSDLARAILNALSSPHLARALESPQQSQMVTKSNSTGFRRSSTASSDALCTPEYSKSPGQVDMDGKGKRGPKGCLKTVSDSVNSLRSPATPSSASKIQTHEGKHNMLQGIKIAQADEDAANHILKLAESKFEDDVSLISHLLGFLSTDTEELISAMAESNCSPLMFVSAYLHNMRQASAPSSVEATTCTSLIPGNLDPKYQTLLDHMVTSAQIGPSARTTLQEARKSSKSPALRNKAQQGGGRNQRVGSNVQPGWHQKAGDISLVQGAMTNVKHVEGQLEVDENLLRFASPSPLALNQQLHPSISPPPLLPTSLYTYSLHPSVLHGPSPLHSMSLLGSLYPPENDPTRNFTPLQNQQLQAYLNLQQQQSFPSASEPNLFQCVQFPTAGALGYNQGSCYGPGPAMFQ